MFPLNRPTPCRIFLRTLLSTVLSTFFFSSLIFSTRLLQATPESITTENSPTHVETVLVDDPENHPDSNSFGSVDYLFQIGKYDITAEQWCALLQAVATKSDLYGLFNEQMQKDPASCSIKRTIVVDPATHRNSYCYKIIRKRDGDTEAKNDPDSLDRGKLPITYVDFYAAVRYCNWLSLGQPNIGEENIHSTEDGPYTIQGKICRAHFTPSQQAYDHSKWPGGLWRLPSEDEWYKAAYYEKATPASESHYWLYSTRSDSAPYNFIDENYNQPRFDAQGEALNGSIANANYTFTGDDPLDFTSAYVNKRTMEKAPYVTPVGAFHYSKGPFGTYDMGGNVMQWVDNRSNERLSNGSLQTVQVTALRGGSWKSDDEHISSTNSEVPIATIINNDSGEHETSILKYSSNDVGFRVACMQPDPVDYNTAIARIMDQYKRDWHDYVQDYYTNPDASYNIRIANGMASESAYLTTRQIELAAGACDFLLSLAKAGITYFSPGMMRRIFDNVPGPTIPPLEDYWKSLQGTLRNKYEGIALERALQQASRDAKKRLFFDLVNIERETSGLTEEQIRNFTRTVYGTESLEEAANIAVQRSEGIVSARSTAVISREAANVQVAADRFWAREFAGVVPAVEDVAHIASTGVMLIPEAICYTYAAPVVSALLLTYLTYSYFSSSGSASTTRYGMANTTMTFYTLATLSYDVASCFVPELKAIKYSIPYLRYLL